MFDGKSLNEAYEQVAAEFYRETGIMAPGKDDPTGRIGLPPDIEIHDSYAYRCGAWDVWNKLKELEGLT